MPTEKLVNFYELVSRKVKLESKRQSTYNTIHGTNVHVHTLLSLRKVSVLYYRIITPSPARVDKIGLKLTYLQFNKLLITNHK